MLTNQLRRLRKLLVRRGATREHAEDLVQEAMLRLHAYTLEGGQVRDPQAFLTRTAMNLAVDAHRQACRSESESIEELDLVDFSASPDEVCAAEQRLIRMREALERANPRTSKVFFMHRLQGFSHAQVAQLLGISVSCVEKHIASAVTILTIQRQQE